MVEPEKLEHPGNQAWCSNFKVGHKQQIETLKPFLLEDPYYGHDAPLASKSKEHLILARGPQVPAATDRHVEHRNQYQMFELHRNQC